MLPSLRLPISQAFKFVHTLQRPTDLTKVFSLWLNKDIVLTIASRIVGATSGFLITIITSHYLGPAGRGDYFFIVTLAAIIAQFSNLGLHSSNTYYIAQDKGILKKLTANSLWVSLLVGGTVSLIVLVISTVITRSPHETWSSLWFIAILVPTTLFYLFGVNLLVGLNKINTYNFCQMGSNLFIILFILLASFMKFGLNGFLSVTTIGWFFASAIVLIILLRNSPAGSLIFHKKVFQDSIRYAMKAYIACLLGFLVLKSNLFLLKIYSDNATIGYFSIASQVIDALAILPTTVGLLLFPSLVRNLHNRWDEAKRSAWTIALTMLICCLIVAILAKPFISIAFGQRFLPSIPILLTMLPEAFFLGIISIISQYLSAIGFPRQLVIIWGFALVIVNLLTWLLAPKYGALGAAIALSVTYCILFFMIIGLAKVMRNRTEPNLILK